MASLTNRAKHKLFSMKKKVSLGVMSPGDAVMIALTAIRASHGHLYNKASKSIPSGQRIPLAKFQSIMAQAVNTRRGSIYASFVTSVDHKKVFRPDQFAIALKRLGIFDDIQSSIEKEGYQMFGKLVATYGPWYWADLVATQIEIVRKENTTLVDKFSSMFKEEVTPENVDELIESVVLGRTLSSPRTALSLAAKNMSTSGKDTQYTALFRKTGNAQYIKLPQSSSFEASFEMFYQHLLTNPSTIRKLLPNLKYASTPFSSNDLYKIFKDPEVKRNLTKLFKSAYVKEIHSINISALFRLMSTSSINAYLIRSVSNRTGKRIDIPISTSILSTVIGLFYAFMSDSKGQFFPTIKG